MSRAIGYLLLLAALLTMAWNTGAAAVFLDLPVLLYFLAGTMGGVLAAAGGHAAWRAMRVVLGGGAANGEVAAALTIIRAAIYMSYAVGAFGAVAALIAFLVNLDHPDHWYLFPPIDLILSLAYALVLSEFLLRPRMHCLRLRLVAADARPPE